MRMQTLTPVLFVESVEPCLAFWTDRLGFQAVAHVEHEGALGFVIAVKDDVQVMYQSHASLAKDLPQLADHRTSALLYLVVDDLDAVDAALGDVERVVERRTTFYGATEIGVREPGGNVVIFSQHGD